MRDELIRWMIDGHEMWAAELENMAADEAKRHKDAAEYLRALAGRSVAVSDGWVMVPNKATHSMFNAFRSATAKTKSLTERGWEETPRDTFDAQYSAMLTAAPPPPAAQPNCSESPKSSAPSDYVLVPRKLTAENGAKAEFMGESYGGVQIPWTAIKQLHLAIVKWAEGQQPIAHGDSERSAFDMIEEQEKRATDRAKGEQEGCRD